MLKTRIYLSTSQHLISSSRMALLGAEEFSFTGKQVPVMKFYHHLNLLYQRVEAEKVDIMPDPVLSSVLTSAFRL